MSAPLLCGLVIAGGRGKRFWPRSRLNEPKQCMDLGDGQSLLESTIERQDGLIPPERIFVVTAAEVADSVRQNLAGVPEENLLVEPVGRNTAACVVWGTMEIARRMASDNVVVAVMPADHKIQDGEGFRRTLADCADAALDSNQIVTIGIEPTRAETSFGYIQPGELQGQWGASEFVAVSRFVEKPDLATAEAWFEEGGRLWNAGIFVFPAETVVEACRQHLPDTLAALEEVMVHPDRLEALYGGLQSISLDHGIIEKTSGVLCTPARFDWSDMGSWLAVAEGLPETEGGRGRARRVVAVDSSDCVVDVPGKVVALLGVEGLVVVETEDALLVCAAERVGEIKAVVDRLEGTDEQDVL